MCFCRSRPKGKTYATASLLHSDKATLIDIKNYKSEQKCWMRPQITEVNKNAGGAQSQELTVRRIEEIYVSHQRYQANQLAEEGIKFLQR